MKGKWLLLVVTIKILDMVSDSYKNFYVYMYILQAVYIPKSTNNNFKF